MIIFTRNPNRKKIFFFFLGGGARGRLGEGARVSEFL